MTGILHTIIQWVGAHPHLTGLFVGIVACTEALAFVGLLVPGAAIMLSVGALVGAGLVGFWGIFAWALGGAVLGDGLSYWLGYRYRDRIRAWGPLQRHPQWLSRGTTFFQRHGGKSVVFARFVGPVRPIIPVVAGMLEMSPIRFYLYNVISAVGWAFLHLLVGMAVGASLVLAGHVATRLVVVLGGLVAAVGLVLWLVRLGYRWIQPRAERWTNTVISWGRAHPRFNWLATDLLDPRRPAGRALLAWLVLLIAATWLFFGVLQDVLREDPLVYAGQALYHLFQQIRTPIGDAIMIAVTELGDAAVTVPVAAAVLLWFVWQRAWRDALYWLSAIAFGELIVAAIKLVLKTPRPIPLYAGPEAYSFPSSHVAMSTVVYGFLAVLIAPLFPARWRWVPYATTAVLVLGISISRLYLGAHWLADVTAGVALGTVWIALLAIALERRGGRTANRTLAVLVLATFVVAGAWHISRRFDRDLDRYAVQRPTTTLSMSDWWDKGWRSLPSWRLDLAGEREQPLNVQWAGQLDSIRRHLKARGWHSPLTLNGRTALRWLLPGPTLQQLPVLPKLHDGRYEALLLVRRMEAGRQIVLRLWPTAIRLNPGAAPLWVGTVAAQRMEHLPLVSFPRLAGGYGESIQILESSLVSFQSKVVPRADPLATDEAGHPISGTLLVH